MLLLIFMITNNYNRNHTFIVKLLFMLFSEWIKIHGFGFILIRKQQQQQQKLPRFVFF